jgi:cysteine sulfinate desulfinase/cysteine desulfurase-like protein
MGVAPEVGIGAVRFSLGRGTTREEIDLVLEGLEHHQQIHGGPDPNWLDPQYDIIRSTT